jgi:hypothetical protein
MFTVDFLLIHKYKLYNISILDIYIPLTDKIDLTLLKVWISKLRRVIYIK